MVVQSIVCGLAVLPVVAVWEPLIAWTAGDPIAQAVTVSFAVVPSYALFAIVLMFGDAWRAVKEYLPRDWGTRRPDGTIGPRTGGDAEDYRWGLERFLDEARILARFDHRHLVRVYRVFEARGTAYMVTEYVEGRTLAAELEAAGPLPESRVREVLFALTDGLSAVHAAGLLHRDIKPGNVMVRPDGTPALIDFGAARQAMGRHSRSVTAVLTPGYAPIEQYSARGHQGPWTDIYALGALAYWALGGGVPEDATERVRNDRLRPLAEVAPATVSAELTAAVDAALAVNEEDRPQSLAEWWAVLDGPAAERPAALRPEAGVVGSETAAAHSGRGSATRWWLAVAAAGLAGAALVVALTAPWRGTVSDDEGAPAAEEVVGVRGAPSDIAAAVAGGLGRTDAPAQAGNQPATERTAQPDPESGEEALVAEQGPAAEVTVPSPAAAEEALGLGRAARRLIQEGLVAAGFDPGVADGLFGAGTRAALREWQAAQGAAATGYLDAAAATALQAAAEEAARVAAQRQAEQQAELEAEARGQAEAQRQAELEAAQRRAAAARHAAELEAEARGQAEAQRQAELEAEARRQAELEAAARQAVLDAVEQAMVVVPAGTFRMGCVSGRRCSSVPRAAGGIIEYERPVHEVRVASFALSKYEVTFEEYDAFAAATDRRRPDDRGWGRGRRPMINVSWHDAVAYAAWLSAETGKRYRLPSEAEWEYAVRAGTTTAYAWGNEIGSNRANCLGCGSRWDREQTAPVGSFRANAWGLHDMHGNVREWVADCWHNNYRGAPRDGSAWTGGGDCGRRVLRNGSWRSDPANLRSANRSMAYAEIQWDIIGFRVSRTLD